MADYSSFSEYNFDDLDVHTIFGSFINMPLRTT